MSSTKPTRVFRVANKSTDKLMEFYDGLYGPSRKNQLNTIGRYQFGRIRKELEKRLDIVEVTPDKANHDLHEQMAGTFEDGKLKGQCKDQVHEFGMDDGDSLREWRLGGKDSTKTAFALINPENRQVLAAIYVSRSDLKVTPDMKTNDRLCGNVFDILKELPRKLKGATTSLIFYSISRFGIMAGEGELLIAKLHDHLSEQYRDQPEVEFSTLSPLRGFENWLEHKEHDLKEIRPNDLSRYVLEYLLDTNPDLPKPTIDLVKRFHLSNGAEVIGIREGANSIGSKDAELGRNFMVHYGYPRRVEELINNMRAFIEAGEVRVSEDLPELEMIHQQPIMAPR